MPASAITLIRPGTCISVLPKCRTEANVTNPEERAPVHFFKTILLVLVALLTAPTLAQAATCGSIAPNLTRTSIGHASLLVFFIAYLMPPFLRMMTGLACLQFFGHYLRKSHRLTNQDTEIIGDISHIPMQGKPFDIFRRMARAEWDTLLFFYGIVLCIGGLGFIGYLEVLSRLIYVDMGPTFANASVGIISAIVDNIPVMFAVLSMNPDMSLGHWLLVTLTAGVGGSLLSIGSAAGVALMGQAQGRYTFFGHLKWAPVILLGYAASILTHMWINSASFHLPSAD
jgi:hypothetical protein